MIIALLSEALDRRYGLHCELAFHFFLIFDSFLQLTMVNPYHNTAFCPDGCVQTALKLIKTHGTIEKVVAALRREKKYDIPPDWQPIRVSKKARLLAEAAQAKADEEAAEAAEALAKAELEAQMQAVAAAKAAAAAAAAEEGSSSSSASASASSSGEEGDDMVVAGGEEAAAAATSAEEAVGDKEAGAEVVEGQEAMAVVEGEDNVAAAEASAEGQEPEEKENVQTAANDIPAVVSVSAAAAVGSDSCGGVGENVPAPVASSSSSSSSSSDAAAAAAAVDNAEGAPSAAPQDEDEEPEILNIATEGDEVIISYHIIYPNPTTSRHVTSHHITPQLNPFLS